MKLPISIEGGACIAVAVPSSEEYTAAELDEAENVILIDGVVHDYFVVDTVFVPANSGTMLRLS